MANIIGDCIRFLLFRSGATKHSDLQGNVYGKRVKRSFVPNRLVKSWEKVETDSIKMRTVQIEASPHKNTKHNPET